MASFEKTGSGWRAQVARRGVRLSRTFATKRAAELWAAEQERIILDGQGARWPRKTVRDAVERYADTVGRQDRLRLIAFLREFPRLAEKRLSEVTAADVAEWRDEMLRRVTPATVKRYSNTLRSVWRIAKREWLWCGDSPWSDVTMPPDSAPRTRVASWREVRAILRRCQYRTGHPPVSGLQNVAWAFLVALRTAMRASEVLGLTRADVSGSVVTLTKHKTVKHVGVRRVPLTPQGARLLRQLVGYAEARKRDRLLDISSSSLEAQFRKVTQALLIEGLRFHDSRGTALTLLSRRVELKDLARISGHQDLGLLARVYYRATAEQIAEALAAPIGSRPRPARGAI